jgi:hypothetical protein
LKTGNLISNDPMLSAVFEAGTDGLPEEKLNAVIRAGKVAEVFACGGTAFDAVVVRSGVRSPLFHQNHDPAIAQTTSSVIPLSQLIQPSS